ncbi:unnamed protein product, partial [marine sediment metagenome]
LVFGAVEVIRYTEKRAESAERAGHIRFATAAEADEESIGQFLLQNVEEVRVSFYTQRLPVGLIWQSMLMYLTKVDSNRPKFAETCT